MSDGFSGKENLRDQETLLETLQLIRDEHGSTHVVLKRIRDDYARKMLGTMRQLGQRMNELEGEVADPSLADGCREDLKVELEKRLRRVRAQQLSLQDAAVAAYVQLPSAIRVRYAQASWLLERELVRQIERLSRREFGNRMVEFRSLKRREVWQASHYHQLVRELYERLTASKRRAWMLVQHWNDQVREVCWDMTRWRAEMKRIELGPVGDPVSTKRGPPT